MLFPVRSVLVLRFGAVGDVVLTSPALQALEKAWPHAKILFATKAAFADLVRHHPAVDEVVHLGTHEGFVSYRRKILTLAPDAVLDLHGKLRSRALSASLPAGRKIRWHKRPLSQALAVRLRLAPYHAKMHIAARYHLAVEELVGQTLPRGELRYYVSPEQVAQARRRLESVGIDLARPVVGLAAGAVWPTKRWPYERFAALGARVLAHGAELVLTGGPADAETNERIAQALPKAADLTGALSLGELGGVMSLLAAFVANDSGPMHIARALGVPTLAFFGCTDPAQFDFTGHALMFAGVDCSPCSLYGLRRCPLGHFRCMLDLGVESAWRALEPLLAAGRRPFVAG